MAERLRWWVIPGALIVLARVVTLGDEGVRSALPASPETSPSLVAVHEASGARSAVSALGAASEQTLVIELSGHDEQSCRMAIWRHDAGQRDGKPWLTLEPRVRTGGTIPVAGLAAGRYDLELQFGEGASCVRFAAHGVDVPGHLRLSQPVPAPKPRQESSATPRPAR